MDEKFGGGTDLIKLCVNPVTYKKEKLCKEPNKWLLSSLVSFLIFQVSQLYDFNFFNVLIALIKSLNYF